MKKKTNDKDIHVAEFEINSQNKRSGRVDFTNQAQNTKPYDISRMTGKPQSSSNNNNE